MIKYIGLSLLIHAFIIFLLGLSLNLYQTNYSQMPNIKIINIHTINDVSKVANMKKFKQKLQENQTSTETTDQKVISSEITPINNNSENNNYSLQKEENKEENITPPRVLYSPTFHYPYLARIKSIEGTVILEITIGTNGRIISYNIMQSSGYNILDKASIEYINQLVFEPAKDANGNYLNFHTTYTVHFILESNQNPKTPN